MTKRLKVSNLQKIATITQYRVGLSGCTCVASKSLTRLRLKFYKSFDATFSKSVLTSVCLKVND